MIARTAALRAARRGIFQVKRASPRFHFIGLIIVQTPGPLRQAQDTSYSCRREDLLESNLRDENLLRCRLDRMQCARLGRPVERPIERPVECAGKSRSAPLHSAPLGGRW